MDEVLNHVFGDLRSCIGGVNKLDRELKRQRSFTRAVLLFSVATALYFATEAKYLNTKIEELKQKGD